MQMSKSKLLSDSLKTQQSFNNFDQIDPKQRILDFLKQKQSIIHQLKKTNLIHIPPHLNSQQKNISADPFLNWLQENSQEKKIQQNSEDNNQLFEISVNEKFDKKQKKLRNNKLPKIHSFVPTQKISFLTKCSNKKVKKPLWMQNKSPLPSNARTKQSYQENDSYKNLIRSRSQYLNYSKKSPSQNHKSYCYRNNLSKTQLFQKNQNISDEEKLKNIRTNFYLNDHKKLMITSTFFITKKPKVVIDFDLNRVKDLSKSNVKSFEENLQILEKKASLTCYNQVSQNFASMKKQIQALILKNSLDYSIKNEKRRQIKDQINQRQSKFSTRIKTQSNECEYEVKECYLPKFLMKSLDFPKRTSNSHYLDCKKVKNLRT